jgi:hypothetical protein
MDGCSRTAPRVYLLEARAKRGMIFCLQVAASMRCKHMGCTGRKRVAVCANKPSEQSERPPREQVRTQQQVPTASSETVCLPAPS